MQLNKIISISKKYTTIELKFQANWYMMEIKTCATNKDIQVKKTQPFYHKNASHLEH
jgi:hypothetical protein